MSLPSEQASHLSRPVVVCVAPNGARRGKADHPALPITVSEIAAEARACAAAGATVMHLHVRDEQGGHSLDVSRYRAALAAIKEAVGDRLLVQITTESVGLYSPEQQHALLRALIPRLASVALRELLPDPARLPEAARLFKWAGDAGVGLQYIVYTSEEAAWLVELARQGVIPERRPNTLFVLGRYTAGQQSSPHDLLPFLRAWPADWPWSVCAFGASEALCMAAAIALGGNVRVGFENNLLRPDGAAAAGNGEIVANVRDLAARCGRPLAGVADAAAIYCAAAR